MKGQYLYESACVLVLLSQYFGGDVWVSKLWTGVRRGGRT